MQDDRKISLCIPTWNRFELLIDSFINVLHDDRISEIVICDDASDMEIYEQVKSFCDGISKIKLFRNDVNIDCYRNKRKSIELATNEWAIILDSDNKIDKDYLDILYSITEWVPTISYMPSFAAPAFNYKKYEGILFSKENVSKYIGLPFFDTMLNCMNLFISKFKYLEVWEDVDNPRTADSIYFNYCWFKNNHKMLVVPKLTYQHLIHEGSHYVNNVHLTPIGLYESIVNKLKTIK